MIFDLFKLTGRGDTPDSWIWVEVDNKIVLKQFLEHFKKNSRNNLSRIISKELNCGFSTITSHLIRIVKTNKIILPLPILNELIKIINPRLKLLAIKSMKYFWSYSDRTKKRITIPIKINNNLAKIIGAHMADGYLKKEGLTYKIKITDGRKDGINAFCIWIREVFNLDPHIKYYKNDNTWNAFYSSKVIGRFFENIIGIKSGKKYDIAKEPEVIKKSNLKTRSSFALGVMTFDGAVKTSGMVSITSMSKELINDLETIFQLNHININKTYNKNKKSWLIESTSGRNVKYLKMWQKFFEAKTWKRDRLDFFINNKKSTMEYIEYLFPKHYLGKLCVEDIHEAISYIKTGQIDDILNYTKIKDLGVAKTTLYKYVKILQKSGLIKVDYKTINKNGTGGIEAVYTIA